MHYHDLDPKCDVHVEYKNAYDGGIVSLKTSDVVKDLHLIRHDDLEQIAGGTCLYLCFRNTTGNEIDFLNYAEVTDSDLKLSAKVLSIDPNFKNSRSRSIG